MHVHRQFRERLRTIASSISSIKENTLEDLHLCTGKSDISKRKIFKLYFNVI